MRDKSISIVFLIGICVLGPSITYANTGNGAGQTPTLRAQAVTLATVLQRFMASPDANSEMLKHELPTLNRLNKLNLDDPNSHATLTPLIHALAVSVEGASLSYMLDSADDSIPSDVLVKAKKWKTLHQIVGNYAFSRYLSNEIRDLIGTRADYYRSKLTEEKQRELSEAMQDIQTALEGNLPAQLTEAEVPTVDARAARIEHTDKVALAVSRALNEGLEALAAAPPNPTLLTKAQTQIGLFKIESDLNQHLRILDKLMELVKAHPRDEALQLVIYHGLLKNHTVLRRLDYPEGFNLEMAFYNAFSPRVREIIAGKLREELGLEKIEPKIAAIDAWMALQSKPVQKAYDAVARLRMTAAVGTRGEHGEAADDLIFLVQKNPEDEILHRAAASGIARHYRGDAARGCLEILQKLWDSTSFLSAQDILREPLAKERALARELKRQKLVLGLLVLATGSMLVYALFLRLLAWF